MNYEFSTSANDIEQCHQLETEYANLTKYGSDEGFFIKVEAIDIYHRLSQDGSLLVAKVEEQVAGFILMIPPGDEVMHRLLESNCLEWFTTNNYTADNCTWIAKIAVARQHKRKGLGAELIQRMGQKYRDAGMITTTALFPTRNNAIEATLSKTKFSRQGVYVSAAGVNTLWGPS